jgi:hypothetical protein
MYGITNPQLDSKKPNYYTSQSKEQEEQVPNQERTYKSLLGNTNVCLPQVKKLVTKQTIPTEMRKKNSSFLPKWQGISRKKTERERERERDSPSNTKDMNTPHSHNKATLLLQNLQRRRPKTHAEDFV